MLMRGVPGHVWLAGLACMTKYSGVSNSVASVSSESCDSISSGLGRARLAGLGASRSGVEYGILLPVRMGRLRAVSGSRLWVRWGCVVSSKQRHMALLRAVLIRVRPFSIKAWCWYAKFLVVLGGELVTLDE